MPVIHFGKTFNLEIRNKRVDQYPLKIHAYSEPGALTLLGNKVFRDVFS